MRAVRWGTIPLVILALSFAGLAGLAGSASADDLGVVQAVQKQDNKISGDSDVRKLGNLRIRNVAQARHAEGVYRRVEARLRSASRAVAKTKGSSKLGRRAKADWINATRGKAYGYEKLVTACVLYVQHRVGPSNSAVLASERAFRSANKLIEKANRELRTIERGVGR